MDPDEDVNEVVLVGRVSAAPERRELPSGDELWVFRLVVRRPPGPAVRRATVDTLDCAVWSSRPRRSVAGWGAGDVVRVQGALRRRFFRTSGGAASRVEVEVGAVRMLRRARTGARSDAVP